MPATRYIRFLGADSDLRPVRPPLPVEDALAAYAPFAYETEEAAIVDCARELARRWAEVAEGLRCPEAACLGHYIVECTVDGDGRIEGGTLVQAFREHWGGPLEAMHATEFWVDMSREEVERLTRDVDEDGWCTGR